MSVIVVQSLGPLEGARCLNDKVVLAVVDHYVDFLGQQILDQGGVGLHEILVHGLVDVAGLRAEVDLLAQ